MILNSKQENNAPTKAPTPFHHPHSVQGTQAIIELLRAHDSPRTLVLVVISGGGSALLTSPLQEVGLQGMQAANKVWS